MSRQELEQELEALLRRKADLEARLGMTRAGEKASTRKSDTKYRVNSGRAVQARAKKSEKALLRTVNQMIQQTRNRLRQEQDQEPDR